jgi:hypothetical protein
MLITTKKQKFTTVLLRTKLSATELNSNACQICFWKARSGVLMAIARNLPKLLEKVALFEILVYILTIMKLVRKDRSLLSLARNQT